MKSEAWIVASAVAMVTSVVFLALSVALQSTLFLLIDVLLILASIAFYAISRAKDKED